MTSFYLASALLIAVCLNHGRPAVRALGRLLAGLALTLVASSILLANLDGTFAADSSWRPLLLNIEGVLYILAAGALFWSILPTLRRPAPEAPPLLGSRTSYGQLSRLLHWTSGALMISAFPMGQFVAVLAPEAPERASFLAVHMAIGAAIFLLIAARMIVRLTTPAPSVPPPVMVGHALLYALVIAVSLTGFALATQPVDLYGLRLPNLPPSATAESLHRLWLPILLVLIFIAHLGGAVHAIRRMAR
ncbi:cytochrome b/b6 domain-containing protein [Polymorphobacter sp.]|uniref:cytochrome b/b6 domain-containing protein n=1 Tax=Polymorphobacter sp. TaxID=1909290 RepID=UPI003F7068AE